MRGQAADLGPLASILWAKRRITRHWIASVRRESKLKVAFVSTSAVFLWLGMFLVASIFFRVFEKFGAELLGAGSDLTISDVVLARMLSVFALTLFVMLIVSNVLVSFATLYRSREVSYLIQSPISIPVFFLGRFYECVTFSSWAVAFLGSPVLLAYGLARQASPLFYLALLAFYLPFVTIPAALGSSLTMVLVRVFSRLGGRRALVAGVLLVVVVALFVFFRQRLEAPDLATTTTVQTILDAMGQTQSAFLPSFWVAQGVLGAAAGELGEAGFYFLLLLANALLLVWVAALVAEACFYSGWTSLVGGGEADKDSSETGRRRPRTAAIHRLLTGSVDRFVGPLPQPTRVLVAKDVKLFWRDPAQWSQFVLFFGIMALYLANLRGTSSAFNHDVWRNWIALLNTTACMLILATLTTRFIFPLISLEGRRFWILGLAPLTLRRLVWQKFLLSVSTTSVFTVGLGLLSGVQLRLDPLTLGLSLTAIAATTVALSGLAVGLGSLYPNFQEDNPSRITSGLGGTLNFMLSLLYIVLVTVAQGVILHRSALGGLFDPTRLPWALTTVLAAIVVLTLITWLVPMRLGLKHLEEVEF